MKLTTVEVDHDTLSCLEKVKDALYEQDTDVFDEFNKWLDNIKASIVREEKIIGG